MNSLYLEESASLGEVLKKTMFPEDVMFLGFDINPTLAGAFIVTFVLLLISVLIRIFVIPKFNNIPKPFQMFLESLVKFFDKIARETAEKESGIIGCYIFTAALYICFGTLIELLGMRPLMSSINTCVALAFFTYILLIYYGIRYRGVFKGFLNSLKEITVPISMTFRLFGSILSGYLIMAIVYHYIWMSFAVPAAFSVMFTLFHAFIQSYIFAMLSSLFIGEALEYHPKKKKSDIGGVKEG